MAGAAILVLGLFSPVVQAPLGITRNYFNQPTFADHPLSFFNGVAVVLLLVVVVIGTAANSPRAVGITSIFIGVLLLLALVYYEVQNPRNGYGQPLGQLSWGWGLLLIGEGLMFGGGVFGAFPQQTGSRLG